MRVKFIHLTIVSAFALVFVSSCDFNFYFAGAKYKAIKANALVSCTQVFSVQKPADYVGDEFSFAGVYESVKILNGTFLGNSQRNYYGDSIGADLDILWKTSIGKGKTICVHDSIETWMGAGWTGQPLMVEENGTPFIIQGCYDHNLKKVNALTGEIVWDYLFDDILKGTGTLYINKTAKEKDNQLIVMQGSRIGFKLKSWKKEIFSYRAVSYFSGKENWRMNVKRGASYSRDVDASALVFHDTAYIGLENGIFTVFDPRQQYAETARDSFRPKILQELDLFSAEDKKLHGGELVTESSPCKIDDHLYITSGSGHVYGYNLKTKKLDWDFYTGSDLDGSPVVTNDKCLIITIEKQFIKGCGGAMKIDPHKPADSCVVWYFPTGDKKFSDWKGGIIGSAAVGKSFLADGKKNQLCAFMAIDGFLYVVNQNEVEKDSLALGPDSVSKFRKPKMLYRQKIGASISTPLIIGNRILAAGYTGLYILEYDKQFNFRQLSSFKGFFEATPFVNRGRVYLASRNGFLYCFGKKEVSL